MDTFTLPTALEAEMLDHARRGGPDEVIGFLIGPAGTTNMPHRVVQLDNVATNPGWYCEPNVEQLEKMFAELDERGEDHHAVYHSHPVSPSAMPSDKDISQAEDLDTVHIIVAPNAVPTIRAWRIEARREGRVAVEVPIVRTSSADQIVTMQAHLVPDNVIALAYSTSAGEVRSLTRVRVVRMQTDSVVVVHERRQTTIGLDRIRSVQLLEESAALGARRREFAAQLLRHAADLIDEHRIGDSRAAVEASCHALPGLRPRMGE